MKYYHEHDFEKCDPLVPNWMCGAYINGDFVNITDIDDDVLEEMEDDLVEGYFLVSVNEPYATPYGPCTYDAKTDVYTNCDGFEIRRG